ncbi:UDP-N-acetylglucosamine 2-epimerase (hydrolyzing) [Clostridium sp. D2Q-14]|uniref:UDP-N-acetylglucosamine 2-epimerase n=1 Tax=Anaeromonas gelatinilytica TaxID=2683194 RepID=UPI00193B1F51|nr:UDP-N-acetylglucosamine 2-epimerase [Anaeromonas gelatinilytica]MBS4534373.1 UDP-N-acetylglucosamine 2-epimerase (hydrolyzing) [Anaeromonas gelatinilytica]
MKKRVKVLFFTGNRSEYGLLAPIIKRVSNDSEMEYRLIVSGAHLSKKYGNTVEEIENDGINIDYKIDIESSGSSDVDIVFEASDLIRKIGPILTREMPDYFFVLGDRYETFAAAQAAFFCKIPIVHSGGGNVTQGGCLDDTIRHLITKMSALHFVTCEVNGENIKKLGEESWRILISGSPAVETVLSENLLSMKSLEEEFGVSFNKPVILFTQHPVASSWEASRIQVRESLKALQETGYQVIITYPNTDAGGAEIIEEYKEWFEYDKFIFVENLGRIKYLSFMKYVNAVVGNSSSGLLETPIFKTPTVNIGNRQKGRIRSTNVIDVDYSATEIRNAVDRCINDSEFLKLVKESVNPFGDGQTSRIIVDTLKEYYQKESLLEKELK